MELVCPAGNYPSLKAAVDNGADAIFMGLNDDTNARHFAGLNFNTRTLEKAIDYAHRHNRKVFMAINTYPQQENWNRWKNAVDVAASLGVDALIMADISLHEYALQRHPDINRHLSVQGSATNVEALKFYAENFGIKRAVLPRVLSLKQVERLAEKSPMELEVFGFGSLCIMAEGRCHLSSYLTNESPNTCGACSPANAVRWEEKSENNVTVLETRLNGVLIDKFQPNETTGYPTLCKGRFKVQGHTFHSLEEPTSLNAMDLLPALDAADIKAIKIEGRQRSPAYVAKVTSVWRQAIDRFLRAKQNGTENNYQADAQWSQTLAELSEGSQTTLGAFHRSWQ